MTSVEIAALFLRIAARVLIHRISISEEDLRRLRIEDFLPKDTLDEIIAKKKKEELRR